MSRIGKLPIAVPSGVDVTLDDRLVTVKGPKGTLSHTVAAPITVQKGEDGALEVKRPDDERESRSLHGLTRTLIANMVEGVTKGYMKQLEITGVGYKAEPKPYGLVLALGYSHPIVVEAPEGVTFEVPQPTRIIVNGIDKERVGQVAANIRSLRKPEPYKGKGVKYAGERILRKAGKAGKK